MQCPSLLAHVEIAAAGVGFTRQEAEAAVERSNCVRAKANGDYPPLFRMCAMQLRLVPFLAVLVPITFTPIGVQARPIVLELFTSQGCSSCPPAEALLGEYAGHSDLLPLGFHVTYWDDLGWKDTYSFEGATERQSNYAKRLGSGSFTPQLIIDGDRSLVGSRRSEIAAAVAQAREQARPSAGAHIVVTRHTGLVSVKVGAGQGSARVLLIGFDPEHRTAVARGENGGRTIAQANVVRSLRDLGPWAGQPLEFSVAAPTGEDLAVILQSPNGRILGAARSTPAA